MKTSLTFEDLAENANELNDFLSKKGMSSICGGQVVDGGATEIDTHDLDKPVHRSYMQIIYPNYCESTYVDRFVVKP